MNDLPPRPVNIVKLRSGSSFSVLQLSVRNPHRVAKEGLPLALGGGGGEDNFLISALDS